MAAESLVQDLTTIECPICTDPLTDPRALPCGHSYCGPPKPCLRGVEKPQGLQCAVCKDEFDLRLAQLKPLFGIRDFLLQTTSKTQLPEQELIFESFCPQHLGCPIQFYCKGCKENACQKCFDSKHQAHILVSFRKFLHEEVSPLYSSIGTQIEGLREKIFSLVQNFQETSDSLTEEAEKVQIKKLQVLDELEKLKIFEQKWKPVGEFVRDFDHNVNLAFVESFLGLSFSDVTASQRKITEYQNAEFEDLVFSAELSFYSQRTPPVRAVVVKNKQYKVEISFSEVSAYFFGVSCTLSTNDYSLVSIRYEGGMKFRHPDLQTHVRDISLCGEFRNQNSVTILHQRKVHVTLPRQNFDIQQRAKNGFFNFVFNFRLIIHKTHKHSREACSSS